MEAELRNATDFNARSDYAVALMYLGRADEAVLRLQALEKERPGEYYVAANLGTAHELAGNNAEALKWINEGLRRNPDSHEGTEWLHVRILEAKIRQETEPDYFDNHTVLDLDPGHPHKALPEELQTNEKGLDWHSVQHAILHQLSERLQFVKPPDAPVAGLLFDLAMLEAGTHSLEAAVELLKLARDYGYSHARLAPTFADFERRIFWREVRSATPWVLGGVGVVGLLVFRYRKGIFALRAKDLRTTASTRSLE